MAAEELSFFVGSNEEAKKALEDFEVQTTTKFVLTRKTKEFGSPDPLLTGHRILWKEFGRESETRKHGIYFDGVPFFVNGEAVYDCQHGEDKHSSWKKLLLERESNVDNSDFPSRKKRRFHIQDTKKFGCPAKVFMKDIIRFPEFKVLQESHYQKKRAAKALLSLLSGEVKPEMERRIYILFPTSEDHMNHPIGQEAGINQQVDARLIDHIYLKVTEGVRNVKEMKRHLKTFVQKDLFKAETAPSPNNRRFFPKNCTIRNHIYLSTIRLRFSKIDQVNVKNKIDMWRKQTPSDSFFFREYSERKCDSEVMDQYSSEEHRDDVTEDVNVNGCTAKCRLLLIYQTAWQKRLLKKYGNELSMLDATYKTTRYSLPLFFLVVKTNTDYQVVASFVIQDETSDSISEALLKISEWCPGWKPKYFMVDKSDAEINAISSVFSECRIYLCDFHREQAWERWVALSEHGVRGDREEILSRLRRIARATTEAKYAIALNDLRSSDVWKQNQKLQKWLNKTWLPEYKRWAWAFRDETFNVAVRTNNGVERQNRELKHGYLKDHQDSSLSGLLAILVENYFPDKYCIYIESNARFSGKFRKYNAQIPEWLQQRPHSFIEHCLKRIPASEDIHEYNVVATDAESGQFKVKSQQSSDWNSVSFGDSDKMPQCTCLDWCSSFMLCKHFLAVMRLYKEWTWYKLPRRYIDSPYFNVDEEVSFGTNCQEAFDENVNESCDVVEEAATGPLPLPVKRFSTRSQGASCREVLGQLRSLTYLVDDKQALVKLLEGLKALKSDFEEHVPKDEGINLEVTTGSRRSTNLNREETALELTSRARKKLPLTGRVGSCVANKRRAQNVSVTESEVEEGDSVIESQDLYDLSEFGEIPEDSSLVDHQELDV